MESTDAEVAVGTEQPIAAFDDTDSRNLYSSAAVHSGSSSQGSES
jgi:hypothetical protein